MQDRQDVETCEECDCACKDCYCYETHEPRCLQCGCSPFSEEDPVEENT